MRTMTLSLLTLASMSTLAAAQPSLTATARTAEAPTTYLQLDSLAGVSDNGMALGGGVGGGIALGASPLWLHGELVHGSSDGFFAGSTGTFDQARIGLESHGCTASGVACIVGGVDLGLQHERITGHTVDLLDSTLDGPEMTTEATKEIAVARLGLDIGGKHLRYRPGLEMSFDKNGVDGLFVGQSVAWRF